MDRFEVRILQPLWRRSKFIHGICLLAEAGGQHGFHQAGKGGERFIRQRMNELELPVGQDWLRIQQCKYRPGFRHRGSTYLVQDGPLNSLAVERDLDQAASLYPD
jgi:hypothetical protein